MQKDKRFFETFLSCSTRWAAIAQTKNNLHCNQTISPAFALAHGATP
jgi:hypothetical protein